MSDPCEFVPICRRCYHAGRDRTCDEKTQDMLFLSRIIACPRCCRHHQVIADATIALWVDIFHHSSRSQHPKATSVATRALVKIAETPSMVDIFVDKCPDNPIALGDLGWFMIELCVQEHVGTPPVVDLLSRMMCKYSESAAATVLVGGRANALRSLPPEAGGAQRVLAEILKLDEANVFKRVAAAVQNYMSVERAKAEAALTAEDTSAKKKKRAKKKRSSGESTPPESTPAPEESTPPESTPADESSSVSDHASNASDKLEDALTCPITMERMTDPVLWGDGHTYERSAIERWMAKSTRSPMTGEEVTHTMLYPNHLIRSLL